MDTLTMTSYHIFLKIGLTQRDISKILRGRRKIEEMYNAGTTVVNEYILQLYRNYRLKTGINNDLFPVM